METVFASHGGCVKNTAEPGHSHFPPAQPHQSHQSHSPAAPTSGLGGQIGELAAALNVIGWNHNQVPVEERVPLQERT